MGFDGSKLFASKSAPAAETHCAIGSAGFTVCPGEETDSSRIASLARRPVRSRSAPRRPGSASQTDPDPDSDFVAGTQTRRQAGRAAGACNATDPEAGGASLETKGRGGPAAEPSRQVAAKIRSRPANTGSQGCADAQDDSAACILQAEIPGVSPHTGVENGTDCRLEAKARGRSGSDRQVGSCSDLQAGFAETGCNSAGHNNAVAPPRHRCGAGNKSTGGTAPACREFYPIPSGGTACAHGASTRSADAVAAPAGAFVER